MSDTYEIPCGVCGESLPVSEVVRIGGNPRAYCLDCLDSTGSIEQDADIVMGTPRPSKMSDTYEISCSVCGDSPPVSEVVWIGGNPRAYCLDCLDSTVEEIRLRQQERQAKAGSVAS